MNLLELNEQVQGALPQLLHGTALIVIRVEIPNSRWQGKTVEITPLVIKAVVSFREEILVLR